MVLIEYHLGLRQVVMALMNWAIDVPQKLLQSDAKSFLFKVKLLKGVMLCLTAQQGGMEQINGLDII
jgi:hypothetical protein